MENKKILFISHSIAPFLPDTEIGVKGRIIPSGVQEHGNEIRTFMPKWDNINERRYQLHEVIRLSGLNVIINDSDHSLLIKVASLQSARIQVYFIDNEDFFQHRLEISDKSGEEYEDNYERAIFYARSVLETLKKLKWYPDVIHCQGWISAFAPFYIKTAYREDPPLTETKVVYSLYDNPLKKKMPKNIKDCLALRHITADVVGSYHHNLETASDLQKFAMAFSDGIVQAGANCSRSLLKFAAETGKPIMPYNPNPTADDYLAFYESLF